MFNDIDIIYTISENKKNSITDTKIEVEDFNYLIKEDYKHIITEITKETELLKYIKFPDSIVELIIDLIINDKDVDFLTEALTKNKVLLYSMSIKKIKGNQVKYKKLIGIKSADKIEKECNSNNLLKGIELAKKINKKTIINGESITFREYEYLLSNYDFESLNGYDIKISYQKRNKPITTEELLKTSIEINKITDEIEKYNLSPLEKIIYAYDISKSREHKKSDKSISLARDLNKILLGEEHCIVCSGFSNLLNALLKNLNINALPFVNFEKKHQRSIVYIKDDKYKIDGVYVFDPTGDCKSKDNYINNYNCFGITMKDSEKDCPCYLFKISNISFEKIRNISIEQSYENFSKNMDELSKLELLFKFACENSFEELFKMIRDCEFSGTEKVARAGKIHIDFRKKYNPENISSVVFFNALINTRLIEYYNGMISKIDIEEIIEATKDRAVNQTFKYSDYSDPSRKFLEAVDKDIEVSDKLMMLLEEKNEEIERKRANIKLLKVLRNKKNN